MQNSIRLTDTEFNQLLHRCEAAYGAMNRHYLGRSLETVYNILTVNRRVYAIRVDLRFAKDIPDDDPDVLLCLQRSDPSAITRFMESLKCQIKASHARNKRRGEPRLPAYIWCREQETSAYPHYHLVLLFFRDDYAFLGNYLDHDGDNIGVRVQRAWCSALELPYPEYAELVNFSSKGQYQLFQAAAISRDEHYCEFLFRMAYLSKQAGKSINDGQRNFGCSQVR